MDITCPNCKTRYRNLAEKYRHQSLHCKKCQYRFSFNDCSQKIAEQSVTQQAQQTQLAAQQTQLAAQQTCLADSDELDNSALAQQTQLASSVQQVLTKSIHKSELSAILNLGSVHFMSAQIKKSPHDWQVGDVLLDLYEIKRVLGEGQFGKVFQVHHRDWNIDLAVKTPKEKALSVGYETIKKEAETWVNLDLHPNIVNCYYVRRIDDVPQIFSEYVDGGDLKAFIVNKKLYQGKESDSLLTILDIAIQFAWGLHSAHEQGLIHQDIKPANVMLTSDGVIKITDFGLAKAGAMADVSNSTANQTVVINGMGMTPAYASPEQLAGKPLTRRTDLWSWAVCVLEMLLGYCSWESGSVAPGVLEAYNDEQLDEKPAIENIPPALEVLLASCFVEQEQFRPSTLLEAAQNLLTIYEAENGQAYSRQQPQQGSHTASSLNNQAISLLDLGQSEDAVKSWKSAINTDSNHFSSHYNLLLYQWKNAALDENELLSRVIELIRLQEKNQSEQYIERIRTALAKLYLQFACFDQAIQILTGHEATLHHLPSELSFDAYKILGLALCAKYRLLKNPEKWHIIIQCLHKALADNESDPYLITAYTLALQRNGQTKLASRFFAQKSASGLLPQQFKQSVALFLPGYEVLYRIAKKNISHAQFIKNGEEIIFSQANELLFWHIKEKKIIRKMTGHLAKITYFTLSDDEKIMVSGTEQGDVRIWDMSSMTVMSMWLAHKCSINSLAVSVCGQYLLSAANDSGLCMWEIASQSRVKSFYGEGHDRGINNIQCSPSGNSIASAGVDSILRIWDVKTGHTRTILSAHERQISCVRWLDEQYVLSASEDKTIRLWDTLSGQCIKVFKGHLGIVNSIDIDVHKHFFISASSDGQIRYWDIETMSSYSITKFSGAVKFISMDPSKLFFMCLTSAGIHIVESDNYYKYHAPYLFSLPESALEVDLLSRNYQQKINQARLAMAKKDYSAVVQAVEQIREIKGYEHDHSAFKCWSQLYLQLPRLQLRNVWQYSQASVSSKRISSIDTTLYKNDVYAASSESCIMQWDIESQQEKQLFPQIERKISVLKATADGQRMLIACAENILLMDIKTGQQLSVFCHHNSNVVALTLSADGRFALSSDSQGDFYLWRLLTGEMTADFTDKANVVSTIAVTPDGRYAITGQRNNNVLNIWDLSIGKIITVLAEHDKVITSLAVTSDGRHVLSASADGSLRLWHIQSSRKKSILIMNGHTKRINQVVIDYQNKLAVSVSEDASIRFWDINNGDCLYIFDNAGTGFSSVQISMDGQYVIAGDSRGQLTAWCLDWLLDRKDYHEWHDGANIYLKNYTSTHKTSQPHKEQKSVLSLLQYAGYGWLDENEVAIKLLDFYQANISAVLPANKVLRSTRKTRGKSSNKKIVLYSILSIFFFFLVSHLLQDDTRTQKAVSIAVKKPLINDAEEQASIDKMLDIGVLLAQLNKPAIIHNGRFDRGSLIVPVNIKQLKQKLHLSDEQLTDAWGQKLSYQGVIRGSFQGRVVLRSAGKDRQFKTDDDILLNGFPHWRSLVIRINNQVLISLSEYRQNRESNTDAAVQDEQTELSDENNSQAARIKVQENSNIDNMNNEDEQGYEVIIKPQLLIEP